ncbi:peptidase C19, ubiquitin carboxyl-terminal hydrolase 2 [Tanacetum coccineum]
MCAGVAWGGVGVGCGGNWDGYGRSAAGWCKNPVCDSLGQQDKKSECPFCLLEKRIVRSLSVDLPLDTPSRIIGRLSTFAEHFRVGRQEDAHEFLRYVIDACHTTCVRLKKLQQQRHKFVSKGGGDGKLVSNGGGDGFGGSTVVKEIFGGALQSQVKCSLPISPAPSIVHSPISSPMIPLTVPSPVATPATAETEGFLTKLGAQVEMQGGLIHDHVVRLEELSPTLFERYDRDIGDLFTMSGAVRDEIFSPDIDIDNQELQLQLVEERRARLELAEIVDNIRRGQEPPGDV